MRWLVLFVVLVTASCAPIPHRANLTPGVAGRFLSSGTPIASKELRLVVSKNAAYPCQGTDHVFKTNVEGEFYSPPLTTFSWFIVVMAHAYFPWGVCTEEQGNWVPIFSDKTYSLVDTGPTFLVELWCESMQCEGKENWSPSHELIQSLEKRNQ